jgi:hypothetical protein
MKGIPFLPTWSPQKSVVIPVPEMSGKNHQGFGAVGFFDLPNTNPRTRPIEPPISQASKTRSGVSPFPPRTIKMTRPMVTPRLPPMIPTKIL